MKLSAAFFIFFLSSLSGPGLAADKTSPEFLRSKNAGVAEFGSHQSPTELFSIILKAAQDCYVGETDPSQFGIYGAVGSRTGASRVVEGHISDDGRSAYVQIRARGGFGLLESAFLQVDIESDGSGGTHLIAYHKNKVKAQREFLARVGRWVSGDLSACPADPYVRPKKGG